MCMYPANAVPSCAAGAHLAMPACVHADDDVQGPRSRPDGKPHDQPSTTPRLALSVGSLRVISLICRECAVCGLGIEPGMCVARGCGVSHFHFRVTLAVHMDRPPHTIFQFSKKNERMCWIPDTGYGAVPARCVLRPVTKRFRVYSIYTHQRRHNY